MTAKRHPPSDEPPPPDAARPAPHHPGRLVGSAWTSRAADLPYCHWTVVAVARGEAELAAVLAPATRVRLPWRALRDRARWQPGWR